MTNRTPKIVLILSVAFSGATYAHGQKTVTPVGPTAQKASSPRVASATTTTATSKATAGKTSTSTDLNPALKLLNDREKQLLDEINYARANPGEYLKALEAFKKNYRSKEIHFPEGRILVTNEGVAALDDALAFLRGVKPLPPLELRGGMVQAAKTHANDLGSSGKFGHRGSDGSQPGERIDRFGRWDDSYGENIVYESHTPRYDVIGMIIDDGTANRGHRENLFAEDFRVIGIAFGTRSSGTNFAVVTFAGGFQEKK